VLVTDEGQFSVILCDSQFCIARSMWRSLSGDTPLIGHAAGIATAYAEILEKLADAAGERAAKQFGVKAPTYGLS
jgi:hypothetical protein